MSGPANVVTDSSGQVQFRYLVQVGTLVKNTTTDTSPSPPADRPLSAAPPSFIGSGSYTRYWDQCSSTPSLMSQSQRKVILYDDPESLQLKARYAVQRGWRVLVCLMFTAICWIGSVQIHSGRDLSSPGHQSRTRLATASWGVW